jgi:hypothetical protein
MRAPKATASWGTAPKRPVDAGAADAGMGETRPHPLGRRPTTAGAHEPLGKPAIRPAGFPQRPQVHLASYPGKV